MNTRTNMYQQLLKSLMIRENQQKRLLIYMRINRGSQIRFGIPRSMNQNIYDSVPRQSIQSFYNCILTEFLQQMKPYRQVHKLNQFNSLGDISLEQLSSSNSRRLSNAFVTQKTIGHEEQIYIRNHELNHYLDKLGSKVQSIISKNEEEMLTAYKNHFFKVKNQLEEFKKLSEDQANSSSSFMEKILVLERQLSIFREQSLKLFSKVTQKDKTIQKLKFQIDELQSQQRHMNQAFKQMARQSKQLSSYRNQIQTKNDIEATNLGIQSYSRQFTQRTKGQITRRPISTTSKLADHMGNQYKTISFDLDSFKENSELERIEKEIKIKLGYLDADTLKLLTSSVLQIVGQSEKRRSKYLKNFSTQRERQASTKNQTKFSVRNKSNYTIDLNDQANCVQSYNAKEKKQQLIRKSQVFSKNLQMNDYFKKCVECVKKQIGLRKKVNTINFYKTGEPISLSDFKKIDFFRLLQLVFSHEQMIQILYRNLISIQK